MVSQYFQQIVVSQSTSNHERSVPLQVLAIDVGTGIQKQTGCFRLITTRKTHRKQYGVTPLKGHSWNEDTSLIRTHFRGPRVSVTEGFHCSCALYKWMQAPQEENKCLKQVVLNYPTCACAAGVKQCLHVSVSTKKYWKIIQAGSLRCLQTS